MPDLKALVMELLGEEVSDFSQKCIEASRADTASVKACYQLLRCYGLKDDKIATNAQLLVMNPETIERNYRNLIGLLRTPFDPRGLEKEQLQDKRLSGKTTIQTYVQLLGSAQETIESNVQYLWSHGMGYQDGILLGTTQQKKREKVAFLLREVFDYRSLNPEEKKEAISEAVMERVKRLAPYLLMAAVLVAAGFSVYFWNEARALKANPQRAAQEESLKLIGTISKLIVLPEGENPTIATVTDPERLREQPFFANAQAGDKVLLFTNSRKAILYNPTQNKIVEVAPINIGNPQP